MADFSLEQLSVLALSGSGELAFAHVEVVEACNELAQRRAQAEEDLRAWKRTWAEVDSLKRRLTALRRTLKYEGLAGAINRDDATRRRFEAKQRKAVRR